MGKQGKLHFGKQPGMMVPIVRANTSWRRGHIRASSDSRYATCAKVDSSYASNLEINPSRPCPMELPGPAALDSVRRARRREHVQTAHVRTIRLTQQPKEKNHPCVCRKPDSTIMVMKSAEDRL